MSIIQFTDVVHQYGNNTSFQLSIHRFSMNANARVFIEGPSGCGKTTFLNLMTGLLPPTQGSIHILDTNITTLNQAKCDRFRANHFGIIFQLFNLIPYLSVIENIILPCTFSPLRYQRTRTHNASLDDAARALCAELDIESSLINRPVNQLSIGQQQRVAIARAFIGTPDIIVADEPTSALDRTRTDQFMTTLLNTCDTHNTSLVFVSHDTTLRSYFDQAYSLSDFSTYKDPSNEPI